MTERDPRRGSTTGPAAGVRPGPRRQVRLGLRRAVVALSALVVAAVGVTVLGVRVSAGAGAELRRLDELALALRRAERFAAEIDAGVLAARADPAASARARLDRSIADRDLAIGDARALAGDDAVLSGLLDEHRRLARRGADEILASFAPAGPTGDAARSDAVDAAGDRREQARRAGELAGAAVEDRRRAAAATVGATDRLVTVAGVVLVAVAVGAGVVVARRVDRQVITPLDDLARTMARLSSGDAAARVTPAGAAELVAAGAAVNDLAGQIERLRRMERHRADNDRAVTRVSRAIREHLEVGPMLEAAAREVGHALQADRVVARAMVVESAGAGWLGPVLAVWDRPPGSRRVPSAHGTRMRSPAPLATRATRSLAQLVRRSFEDASLFWIDDVWTDERLDEKTRRWFDAGDVRSVVVVPILTEELPYALIVQGRTVPRPWTEAELTLLGAVARDLTVALGHAQRYARERGLVAELTELDRAKAEFVSSVSHQLRAPLASIVHTTSRLRAGDAGDLTGMQDGLLRVVERNSDQLLLLLDDLLTVARIEAGSLVFHPSDVDTAAMIRRAVDALRPALDDRHLELAVDVADDLPSLRADPEQMGRALRNALHHAASCTPDGGTVRLRATASDDEVTLAVGDTGAPSPDDTFAQLFQAPPATGAPGRTEGLDLTIVKLVVEGHGGSVEVTSAPGEGTTVNVHLPLEPGDLTTGA